MQRNVSIRNTPSSANEADGVRGNSEASRIEDLGHVLPLWPRELADRSHEGREKIIALLERALRQERRRGRAGHPAYDLERHAALYRMLKRERAALTALRSCEGCLQGQRTRSSVADRSVD